MGKRTFMVVGVTHVDLAWKWSQEEMAEMLEAVAVRVLDALESDPDFKYSLEQAFHYRALAKTRPDLVKRLGKYVRSGRLEMAGCMASTLDTNLPSGESFVRNQLLGMAWVKQNWGVDPQSGWLMDTFGINAQVPQILRQCGMQNLTASRFGGNVIHDAFIARGLDGSEITVIGKDVYAPYVDSKYMARVCYYHWDGLDQVFADADQLEGEGPFVVQALTENEYLISLRPYREVRQRNSTRPNESWTIGTHAAYLKLLEASDASLPVLHGDLNPEFTGCFSLRAPIRLRNRRAESLLNEAEKWACLSGAKPEPTLVEAWWEMAFVQFHDVFTGSHPTSVYDQVIAKFDGIDQAAENVMHTACRTMLGRTSEIGQGKNDSVETMVLFNGLPWNRRAVVELEHGLVSDCTAAIRDSKGEAAPYEIRNGRVFAMVNLPACGAEAIVVRPGPAAGPGVGGRVVNSVTLENDQLLIELDDRHGIRRIICKATGRVMVEEAGGLLVAQRDDGNFQIESPSGAEVPASAGVMSLESFPRSPVGSRAILRGQFPTLSWAGPEARLAWSIEVALVPSRAAVDLRVNLDWKGEGTRIRLRVPTTVNAVGAIYEVPFGTVERKPYGQRGTARGEWPAQRFVAFQDATGGVAVANNGAAGVEVAGGAITTSLIRAPKSVYSGMVPDSTSSGHGSHAFEFALVPYSGDWSASPILKFAQELNTPIHIQRIKGEHGDVHIPSQLSITPETVVLSTVKWPEDSASEDLIVRVYESAGKATLVKLRIAKLHSVQLTDIPERAKSPLPIAGEYVSFEIKPFEIVTLRIKRKVNG